MVSPTKCICASCTSTDLWPWCSAYPVSLLYLYTRHFLTRISLPFLSNGRVSPQSYFVNYYRTPPESSSTLREEWWSHTQSTTFSPSRKPRGRRPVRSFLSRLRCSVEDGGLSFATRVRGQRYAEIKRSRDREIEKDWANDRETERQRDRERRINVHAGWFSITASQPTRVTPPPHHHHPPLVFQVYGRLSQAGTGAKWRRLKCRVRTRFCGRWAAMFR